MQWKKRVAVINDGMSSCALIRCNSGNDQNRPSYFVFITREKAVCKYDRRKVSVRDTYIPSQIHARLRANEILNFDKGGISRAVEANRIQQLDRFQATPLPEHEVNVVRAHPELASDAM